ncbi:MAG TPA: pyrimidine 5'-nucleotidase [Vitreimonas sp.]|uniref:pyrimidine 5'-nucleotidase n=1 Tax=Vitreimonas sp. TaxID=3069702 RepID=UPI002D38CEDC|nr:pyrimidine 5'-nucleotidase [Vitreimonas sp.]HYD87087.1 pyrimidine 5'-nucleotidase [Vitreimonas sp.]
MSSARTIRAWVFDLDNTLYPARDLYDEIGVRMTNYIARTLSLSDGEALEIRERYFHDYGATVVGLVRHHDVDARDFLLDVHTADHSVLTADPELRELIARLPGRRIIFTNGGGGHAERVLEKLNLADLFDAVLDIETCGLLPKPQRESYERVIATTGIEPRHSILIEDTLRNLEPAHDMGFATALVGLVHPEPRPAYVDHWAPDTKALLRALLA